MIDLSYKEECCGCSACVSVCPKNAIQMKPDALGFLYPEIDQSKCINCGLCEKTCFFKEFLKKPFDNNKKSTIYGCRMKDPAEVAKSQSGGATAAIAHWILNNQGVVYGAAFGKQFSVHHTRATNGDEFNLQRGAKYVQSDIGLCFNLVKDDLKKGLFVLFTGTGCQVAGLLKFLDVARVDLSKLYTCDIICHGVPSPQIWLDYVNYIETKKTKKKIERINFRNKDYGWKSNVESFYITEKTYISSVVYTKLFYKNIMLRPCCGVCPYASSHRLSDFTVCDFWHYEKTMAEIGDDDKGLSVMFISSSKAKKVFDEIKKNLIYQEIQLKDCLQRNMQAPSILNRESAQFEKDYISKGFKYVMKKYGPKRTDRIKNFLKIDLQKYIGLAGVNAVMSLYHKVCK